LASIVAHSTPKVVFVSPDLVPVVADARGLLLELPIFVVTGDEAPTGFVTLADLMGADERDVQADMVDTDLADIMYTSGTTGAAKGVAVTYETLAVGPNTEPEWSGNAWLHSAPLFTFAGIGFIHNAMKMGMTALYLPKFEVDRWFDIVAGRRPTSVFIVPALAELIVAHQRFATADLSSLRLVTLGSAPLAPATLMKLQARLPDAVVLNSYGMTEGGPSVFNMDPEGAKKYPDSVGRPVPPTEVRILSEDGRDLPVGQVGEVVTRNPRGRRTYYNDPEASSGMWRDGWLYTGDLGYLNPEGYLFIAGRAKDMVIRGGHNVYAADIEKVLYEDDRILEAAVIGIPHAVLGEDLVACVVLRDPATPFDRATLAEVCAGKLADYKIPRTAYVVDALPRNPTGKVLKRDLRSQWLAKHAKDPETKG